MVRKDGLFFLLCTSKRMSLLTCSLYNVKKGRNCITVCVWVSVCVCVCVWWCYEIKLTHQTLRRTLCGGLGAARRGDRGRGTLWEPIPLQAAVGHLLTTSLQTKIPGGRVGRILISKPPDLWTASSHGWYLGLWRRGERGGDRRDLFCCGGDGMIVLGVHMGCIQRERGWCSLVCGGGTPKCDSVNEKNTTLFCPNVI